MYLTYACVCVGCALSFSLSLSLFVCVLSLWLCECFVCRYPLANYASPFYAASDIQNDFLFYCPSRRMLKLQVLCLYIVVSLFHFCVYVCLSLSFFLLPFCLSFFYLFFSLSLFFLSSFVVQLLSLSHFLWILHIILQSEGTVNYLYHFDHILSWVKCPGLFCDKLPMKVYHSSVRTKFFFNQERKTRQTTQKACG